MSASLLIGLAASAAVLVFMNSAAPDTITLASGPNGSVFEKYAEKYREILARQGVTLKILRSEGSIDNLKKLSDAKTVVDLAFVLGGEVDGTNIDDLFSLGSVSYQPIMIFYRGEPRRLLSDFKGLRLDIGEEGSGTHTLALTLLKANGLDVDKETVIVDSLSGDSAQALLDNRVDALFMMGDSTSAEAMRKLLHTPEIHLFNFTQADAYTRRFNYLNKLELPKGSLDFGKNIPDEDLYLVGPTVELVARKNLHPALSDLLLEAAREVHGTPGLLKRRGEFPAPLEHEFRISPDASRYYTSGKSYLYRTFPFWIASLIARALAFLVPVALVLIPALRFVPAIYRWRMESRIYRWYKALLELDRDAFKSAIDPDRRADLLRRLEHIESAVNRIEVPAQFGDLFYALRGHIGFVRDRLLSQAARVAAAASPAADDLAD